MDGGGRNGTFLPQRHKGSLSVIEDVITGGVWGVAELVPAADLHIVEVVFACAGRWDEAYIVV